MGFRRRWRPAPKEELLRDWSVDLAGGWGGEDTKVSEGAEKGRWRLSRLEPKGKVEGAAGEQEAGV